MQGSPWCALEFRNCAQRLDAQPLRRVRRDAIHKIAQTPHALNERRLADDPSAAEPAQPVNLGERVGDDELLAERAGRLGTRVEGGIQIHFVDQHTRAGSLCQAADGAHAFRFDICARRVVEVRQDDELGGRAHRVAQGVQVGLKAEPPCGGARLTFRTPARDSAN